MLTLGYFLKTTKVAHILGATFSTVKVIHKIGKNGLGYILGDFFTNSSGHLASD
jgi:hypothetical protein